MDDRYDRKKKNSLHLTSYALYVLVEYIQPISSIVNRLTGAQKAFVCLFAQTGCKIAANHGNNIIIP